jgi:hypothetical protein
MKTLIDAAKRLARNPLGVVALFIVVIEVIAAVTLGLARRTFRAQELRPLIWFLCLFPPFVLGVFVWLIVRHPGKLYAPGDFKTEEGFFRSLTIGPTAIWPHDQAQVGAQELVQDKLFGIEDVVLDGKDFFRCVFRGSTLVFRAQQPMTLRDSTFFDVNWRLDGPAARTMDFLKALWGVGEFGRNLVDNTLRQITGSPKKDDA